MDGEALELDARRGVEQSMPSACHERSMSTYRWNTTDAARAYDAAAPVIHPLYDEVQRRILELLAERGSVRTTASPQRASNWGLGDHGCAAVPARPQPPSTPDASEAFLLVDLGGGSGRLVEKVLERFANARAVLVDQSPAFLAIAAERLGRFTGRFELVEKRLQDDWADVLPGAPQAIVSTSAIHHLISDEKRQLYAKCFAVLAPGGMLINGDEFRPAEEAEFLARLKRWDAHMKSAIAEGWIPASFQATFDHWHERNIRNFGAPHKSGDDCQETAEVQEQYLSDAGFTRVETPWQDEMWGILVGRRQLAIKSPRRPATC